MNKFENVVFLLTTTTFAGFTIVAALSCDCTKSCFHVVAPLLFPLVFGLLTYCSQRTLFTSRRLFWTISLVVTVATWIFVFGGSRVTSVVSWKVESCGNYVTHTPVNESFYLWQRPWLVCRFYSEMFRSCGVGFFIIAAFWGLLLPVMGVISALHIWLLSRRHHSGQSGRGE